MNILVANLGSTSFKYRLFRMEGSEETQLASGGYERVESYREPIEDCLGKLKREGIIGADTDIDVVGFKTVLGYRLSGCVEADETALEALEGFAEVAPAHNPAYAAGIRQFSESLPQALRVALFETAFFQWQPEAAKRYAVPKEWKEAGVERYGFHGASHKFIAERSAQLLGREDVAEVCKALYQRGPQEIEGAPLRVVSCHLGGSSSICGIKNGVAVGSSLGFSPQSGLPHNNRVGELDSMAIPFMCSKHGLTVKEAEKALCEKGGLLGLSGVSNDIRDIAEAAGRGNKDAAIAIDVLVHQIRHWIGAFMLQMGGLDAIVFTGGIGENRWQLREAVCAGLEGFGARIDEQANRSVLRQEGQLQAKDSRVAILTIPANEELVIAREAYRFAQARQAGAKG